MGARIESAPRNKKILREITAIISYHLGDCFSDIWRFQSADGIGLCGYRQELSVRHLNRLGRRLALLGEAAQIKIDTRLSGNRAETKLIQAVLEKEVQLTLVLRAAVSELHVNQDWVSEDLLRDLLREREELVHRIETWLESEPVLEHIRNDENLDMSPEPIH